jgi:hypothetical protein
MAVITDNISKATEVDMQEMYDSLLNMSEKESLSVEDRIDVAFFAGKLQVALHYESQEIMDYVMAHQSIIKQLLKAA